MQEWRPRERRSALAHHRLLGRDSRGWVPLKLFQAALRGSLGLAGAVAAGIVIARQGPTTISVVLLVVCLLATVLYGRLLWTYFRRARHVRRQLEASRARRAQRRSASS